MPLVLDESSKATTFATTSDTPSAILSSVRKAIGILELLAGSHAVRLSDVARTLGAPKSTTHRLLKELEDESMVARSGMLYCAGPRLHGLTYVAQFSVYSELRELALPALEQLFESRRETVHLAVMDRGSVLYIEKFTGPGGSRIPTRVGGRMPASCTALGKVMAAFGSDELASQLLSPPCFRATRYSIADPRMLTAQLAEAQHQGYAYEYEESRLGVRCVAAPVQSGRSETVAAISVSSCSPSFDPTLVAPDVCRAARQISDVLHDAGFALRTPA